LMETLKEGSVVRGVVKNITEYGAFVDLGGIDGLLHITDMAWRRVRHPSEVVQAGQEITAKILKFDTEKNRVSLGLKQMGDDPWMGVSRRYPTGTRMFGKVTNIADYGAFVELEPGIEGLVHLSDLSWNEAGEAAVRNFKKGQEVEAIVLGVDVERERISLGIKQLDGDPFATFTSVHDKGSSVTGKVKTVDPKGAEIDLGNDIMGYLRASEISRDRVEDARNVLKEGDEVNAVVVNIDRKTRNIQLSIKQKDMIDEQGAMQSLTQQSARENAGTTNLGALLKAKLEK